MAIPGLNLGYSSSKTDSSVVGESTPKLTVNIPALKLILEPVLGSGIESTAELMQNISDSLQIAVQVKFNGVTLISKPGGSSEKLSKGYIYGQCSGYIVHSW